MRRTVEEGEKERYEFEIEKFRKEQNKQLEGKRGDIDRLKQEKAKVQGEFDAELASVKRELERKFEKEKRELQEKHNYDV